MVQVLDLAAAIPAVEEALRAQHEGSASTLPKTQLEYDRAGTLHALGGVLSSGGLAGTKTWAHTPAGATPLLILWDCRTGELRAVVEAFALGQLRTAAMSAVATAWLARDDADELALFGTGRQSLPQAAAVVAVRPIRRVRVFGRDRVRRAAAVGRIVSTLGVAAIACDDVPSTVDGASVITLVTRAQVPFLGALQVPAGAHINAVGAIGLERAEFEPEMLERCDVVATDSIEQVRTSSRELLEHFGTSDLRWGRVQALSAIVSAGGRPKPGTTTLFKAMGIGLADVALGQVIVSEAHRRGLGRDLAAPQHVQLPGASLSRRPTSSAL